jgi:hypothetical protein
MSTLEKRVGEKVLGSLIGELFKDVRKEMKDSLKKGAFEVSGEQDLNSQVKALIPIMRRAIDVVEARYGKPK